MRRGPVSGILSVAPVLAGLALLHCRKETPPPPPPPAPSTALALDPWTWHFVGGLLVITGEVEETVEVTLKGTTLNETRTLPFGPVRWELYRPPPGEVAELRAHGKLLMKFDFDKTPPPRTRVAAPVPLPEAAPRNAGPPPAPERPATAPLAPPPEAVGSPARSASRQEPARPAPAPVQPSPTMSTAGGAQTRPSGRPEPVRPVPAPVQPAPSRSAGGAAQTRPSGRPEPVRPVPAPVQPAPSRSAGGAAQMRPSGRPEPVRPAPAPVQPAPSRSVAGAAQARPAGRPEPARPAPAPVQPAPSRSMAGAAQARPSGRPEPARPAPAPVRPSPTPSMGSAALARPSGRPEPVRPAPAPVQPPASVSAASGQHPQAASPSRPPAPVMVARSTSNVPAAPLPWAKPAVPPPVKLPEGSAKDWPGAGEGVNLLRGPKGDRRICMTFDGGSTSEVALDVLDALKARNIRTTIFLTGDFIRKYPDLVRRIDRDGHEIGNHTLTHPHLAPGMRRDPRWTRERVQQELLEADRALFRLLGRPMDPIWRAPYGEHTAEIRKWAEELGYRHVGWSEGADTLDWATVKERKLYRTGNAILDRLRARMEKLDGDGLIVLMHLGSGRPSGDRPGQVLGPFLDRALQDGWHFVSIGEYVKGLGKPRWEPVRRVALLR